jgi:hypothetical protein
MQWPKEKNMNKTYNSAPHDGQMRSISGSAGGILRSALLSSAAALAVLVVVYLPAEYGRDPTGFGAVLGLTEMGQIKQQLYAEAEADEAATPAPVDPALLARLAAIEAQLAAISDVIGAPIVAAAQDMGDMGGSADAADAAAPVAQAAPPDSAPDTAPVAAIWRDEVTATLAPGQGIEIKLVMQEGQTARFEWTANGALVNYDTHGDGSGQKISYEQGRGVADHAGVLTAAFTGNHGWFWRNRTDAPVVITLRTAGDYSALLQ